MQYVIGVDEAGRGALAGPVAVGAVLMPAELSWDDFDGLRDSKKLTPTLRDTWFESIRADARLLHSVAYTGASRVDRVGIVRAAAEAAARALQKLAAETDPAFVFLDHGLSVPRRWRQEQFVKGDERHVPIALASIAAKVSRDRKMERLAHTYTEYGFDAHKGYGTRAHYTALAEYGPASSVHRVSFI